MNNAINKKRIALIEEILLEKFHPDQLIVKDESHKHRGHAGAKDGRGHFSIEITTNAFENKSSIERHRLIYQALGNLLQTDIHALRIKAKASSEIT